MLPHCGQEYQEQSKTAKLKEANVKLICIKHETNLHALYIDDLTEGEGYNLKKRITNDPVHYHERTQHILPANTTFLQQQLRTVEQFTFDNYMKINA